jgi:hypothetical protein
LLILNFVLILCNVYDNGDPTSGLLTLPEAAWELSLGIYCAWKGFRQESPIAHDLQTRNGTAAEPAMA